MRCAQLASSLVGLSRTLPTSPCSTENMPNKQVRKPTDFGYVMDDMGNMPAMEVDAGRIRGTEATVEIKYAFGELGLTLLSTEYVNNHCCKAHEGLRRTRFDFTHEASRSPSAGFGAGTSLGVCKILRGINSKTSTFIPSTSHDTVLTSRSSAVCIYCMQVVAGSPPARWWFFLDLVDLCLFGGDISCCALVHVNRCYTST